MLPMVACLVQPCTWSTDLEAIDRLTCSVLSAVAWSTEIYRSELSLRIVQALLPHMQVAVVVAGETDE